jgi:hypothetical protein
MPGILAIQEAEARSWVWGQPRLHRDEGGDLNQNHTVSLHTHQDGYNQKIDSN